jgi:hypothetical protein
MSETGQTLRNRIQVRHSGSETSKTLRNRIKARHSGTGYRSDTLEQKTGQILRVRDK